MKYLIIPALLFISACSVCRFRHISKTERFSQSRINYYYMNPNCPKGSTVEGYNKQGYAFKISILDSTKQTQYYFFLDSEDVIKRTLGSRGGFAEYKLNYDSTDINSLTLIEQHVFNTLSKFSDSLHLKKLDYLMNGKNFIVVKQSSILKKK